MDVVVVGELSCQQELIPVVLFVAREDMDGLFELLIDMFGLAISLQMVSSGCSGFNTDEAPQFASELSDELWTAVGNVLLGGSVVPPNVPVVQPCGSDCTEAGGALVEVGPLTEDVNQLTNNLAENVHVPDIGRNGAFAHEVSGSSAPEAGAWEHMCSGPVNVHWNDRWKPGH
jgi:hypothetical protein